MTDKLTIAVNHALNDALMARARMELLGPSTGVTVAPATASIAVGATQQLTATVAPADASDKTGTWSSSATGKATVNQSGLVTGVSAGAATITFTTNDGAKTSTSAITVTA
ncbi:Ig-like domain-containing protein [Serratia marcescens]|uniref:Ig-like domain-containing protein n=1 Tax=Serratia marcescens TaxID=615 RepID=UPI003BFA67B4